MKAISETFAAQLAAQSEILRVVAFGTFGDRLSMIIPNIGRVGRMSLFRLFVASAVPHEKPSTGNKYKNSSDKCNKRSNLHALNLGVWFKEFKRGVAPC